MLAVQGPGAWPVCSVKAGLTKGGPAPEINTGGSASTPAPAATTPAKLAAPAALAAPPPPPARPPPPAPRRTARPGRARSPGRASGATAPPTPCGLATGCRPSPSTTTSRAAGRSSTRSTSRS
ncbi:hypothetical protein ACFQ1I_11235 [Kitasatospora arboriphila]